MFSFPNKSLQPGKVTNLLTPYGIRTFHEAILWLWKLPYRRTSDRSNYLLVPIEQRGACSVKHALLCEVALEQSIPLHLHIGIFMMDRENTPGIGFILEDHGLTSIPEAHCYLKCENMRYDFTVYENPSMNRPQFEFVHEERVSSDQIGSYKVNLHHKWIKNWIHDSNQVLPFEDLWKIREKCIEALS
ncbi:MAG: hypothetical protein IPK04_15330 [Bdellovibrionales bacterium]|nr:hypothetical protein [Bdellovibrionales bacterium]